LCERFLILGSKHIALLGEIIESFLNLNLAFISLPIIFEIRSEVLRNMGSIALEPKDKILDTEADMRVADTNERPEPSDGGFWAWIQCVTGFCVFFNTFGLLNSFGKGSPQIQNQLC
jgi:hypothetical protein